MFQSRRSTTLPARSFIRARTYKQPSVSSFVLSLSRALTSIEISTLGDFRALARQILSSLVLVPQFWGGGWEEGRAKGTRLLEKFGTASELVSVCAIPVPLAQYFRIIRNYVCSLTWSTRVPWPLRSRGGMKEQGVEHEGGIRGGVFPSFRGREERPIRQNGRLNSQRSNETFSRLPFKSAAAIRSRCLENKIRRAASWGSLLPLNPFSSINRAEWYTCESPTISRRDTATLLPRFPDVTKRRVAGRLMPPARA